MIENYKTLIEAVKRYVERDTEDFNVMMPVFVQSAQLRLCKDLKILSLKAEQTVKATNLIKSKGMYYFKKADGWLNTASLAFNRGVFVKTLEVKQMEYLLTAQLATATPNYFADLNQDFCYLNYFDLQPADSLYLLYYEEIKQLSEKNDTNILIQRYPQLFLYAVLLETASYLRDDERMKMWAAYYEPAKMSAVKEDSDTIRPSDITKH